MTLFLTRKEANLFCSLAVAKDSEIGFQFHHDPSGRAIQYKVYNAHPSTPASVECPITFTTVIGHTHPRSIYGNLKYHPPSGFDVSGSMLNSKQWNLLFEPNGVWAYRFSPGLWETICDASRNGRGADLAEVLATNAANFGASLSKTLATDETGSKIRPSSFDKINTRTDYIHQMGTAILGDNDPYAGGIEVRFFNLLEDVRLDTTLDWQLQNYEFNIPYNDLPERIYSIHQLTTSDLLDGVEKAPILSTTEFPESVKRIQSYVHQHGYCS